MSNFLVNSEVKTDYSRLNNLGTNNNVEKDVIATLPRVRSLHRSIV